MPAGRQIIEGRTVKDPDLRPAHQPQVERGDVGVADERLGIAAKDVGVEIRKQS